jgi:hypothetical protein
MMGLLAQASSSSSLASTAVSQAKKGKGKREKQAHTTMKHLSCPPFPPPTRNAQHAQHTPQAAAAAASPPSDNGDNGDGIDIDSAAIVERVLRSNPVLEAFGNAKTLRNDNSRSVKSVGVWGCGMNAWCMQR